MAKQTSPEKSWERQPKESSQAFEAFNLYLNMGSDRSCHKVAQRLSKSDTIIKRWSKAWEWQKRVRDYDIELQRKELAAKQRELKAMRKRQIGTAVLLQNKAFEALRALAADDLKVNDILRFMAEGIKIERDIRREETEELSLALGVDAPDEQELDDEDVQIYLPENGRNSLE